MRTWGKILLFAGLALGLYSLNMDTSVKVDYPKIGDSTLDNYQDNLPKRVNNLGLMHEQQNYLIFSGILTVVGVIMLFVPIPSDQNKKQVAEENQDLNISDTFSDNSKLYDQLTQIKNLRDNDVLTEEIYQTQKEEILSKLSPSGKTGI